MTSNDEIVKMWEDFPGGKGREEAVISLYRLAESSGRLDGILAMEKELLSDATLEAAMQTFGWGRQKRASIVTLRAILKEAANIAMDKANHLTPAAQTMRK